MSTKKPPTEKQRNIKKKEKCTCDQKTPTVAGRRHRDLRRRARGVQSRTPLSAGTAPGSDRTGAGSRDGVVVGRLFQLKYAG
jgi:hypothetical protein